MLGRPFLFWLLCLTTLGTAQAQLLDPLTEPHQGTVVFLDGDTAAGQVSISLADEVVTLEQPRGTTALPAARILMVRIEEPVPRLVMAHPAAVHGTREVPTLFEVLAPGPYATLLARERLIFANAPYADPASRAIPGGYNGQRLVREYYILDRRAHINAIQKNRAELAQALAGTGATPEPELKAYLKKHRPNTAREQDLINLTNFYNALKTQPQKTDAWKSPNP